MKITMCLMTCGELTEKDCLKAIEPFRHLIVLQEVRNVHPQIKALNQMLDQVKTEYLIPLDADMILDGSKSFHRIEVAIGEDEKDPQWHSILFPLWDTLTDRKIMALKILRTKVMKEFPFMESATPDVEHFQRLTDAGYTCVDRHLSEDPIGLHIVRGAKFCYHKYRDVYQTLRSHGFEWDSGAFMGGETILEKSKKHFDFFFYKWVTTENKDYLYCIAGMMDGLTSPIEHKSKSLAEKRFQIKAKDAVGCYLSWYQHEQNSVLF